MKWIVWSPDGGERRKDAPVFEGEHVDDAVLAWIRKWDAEDGEYPIAAKGHSIECLTVRVTDDEEEARMGCADPIRWRVTGEFEPTYCIDPL
jgi:hypothetical protein